VIEVKKDQAVPGKTKRLRKQYKNRLVAIDPGTKHTGFSFFDKTDLKLSGVINSTNDNLKHFMSDIQAFAPKEIIIEKFTLFPHKALEQSWDTLRVVEVIGILKFWAWKHGYLVVIQQPSTKQAFPDARLKRDGYYVNNIHARDSIRHGLYRIHFGREKEYV
jgi:hypothetical protein